MIQEILEHYYDKKMSSLMASLVTKNEFEEKLSVKLNFSDFNKYTQE